MFFFFFVLVLCCHSVDWASVFFSCSASLAKCGTIKFILLSYSTQCQLLLLQYFYRLISTQWNDEAEKMCKLIKRMKRRSRRSREKKRRSHQFQTHGKCKCKFHHFLCLCNFFFCRTQFVLHCLPINARNIGFLLLLLRELAKNNIKLSLWKL